MQPFLTTARLHLRPATLDDTDVLWALWTEPDVRRYLWDDVTIPREVAAATLAEALALAPRGLGLWLLQEADDAERRVVGCAGLLLATTAAEFEPRLAGLVEPLVALAPWVWGRGFASEALKALQGQAVQVGCTTLAGVTDVPNAASDRMLRRAGFEVLSEVPGPRYALRTYLWTAPPPA